MAEARKEEKKRRGEEKKISSQSDNTSEINLRHRSYGI